jgi:hypothetical protein
MVEVRDTENWSENLKESDHVENLDIYGMIILSRILFTWLIIVGSGSDESIFEHSQVIITTKYKTVTDFDTTNHSTPVYSVYFR